MKEMFVRGEGEAAAGPAVCEGRAKET